VRFDLNGNKETHAFPSSANNVVYALRVELRNTGRRPFQGVGLAIPRATGGYVGSEGRGVLCAPDGPVYTRYVLRCPMAKPLRPGSPALTFYVYTPRPFPVSLSISLRVSVTRNGPLVGVGTFLIG